MTNVPEFTKVIKVSRELALTVAKALEANIVELKYGKSFLHELPTGTWFVGPIRHANDNLFAWLSNEREDSYLFRLPMRKLKDTFDPNKVFFELMPFDWNVEVGQIALMVEYLEAAPSHVVSGLLKIFDPGLASDLTLDGYSVSEAIDVLEKRTFEK